MKAQKTNEMAGRIVIHGRVSTNPRNQEEVSLKHFHSYCLRMAELGGQFLDLLLPVVEDSIHDSGTEAYFAGVSTDKGKENVILLFEV